MRPFGARVQGRGLYNAANGGLYIRARMKLEYKKSRYAFIRRHPALVRGNILVRNYYTNVGGVKVSVTAFLSLMDGNIPQIAGRWQAAIQMSKEKGEKRKYFFYFFFRKIEAFCTPVPYKVWRLR